ncbi:hypothetical protein BJ546DRAFT_620746 [Cryomyces antarcticus]
MSELLNFILTHEEAFRSRSRLASLYSDFRLQAATNPDGYAANIAAWRDGLTAVARAGLIPSQGIDHDLLAIRTGDELARALESREWGRPLALGTVIQDAVARKEMVPLREFLENKTSVYARSWRVSPWQVVSWGLRQLGLTGRTAAEDKLAVGSFVIMANVEAAANAVLDQISSRTSSNKDRIFSRATFEADFAHTLNSTSPLTPNDFTILLRFLSRDRQEISYDSTTIKFKPSTDALPSPITEQDTTIASLRTLIASLTHQVAQLTSRIASLDLAARTAVRAQSPASAKSALRLKKLAEATLGARTASLAQLEDVYASIEQAADQVAIVRVMSASAGVLRDLHAQVGGVEGVDGVVEALREEMEKVDEVSRIVNEVGEENAAVDEDEVDEEFETMERVERERREMEEVERTRMRLEELERVEVARREKEKEKEKTEEPNNREVARKEQTSATATQQPTVEAPQLDAGAQPHHPAHASSKDADMAEKEHIAAQ